MQLNLVTPSMVGGKLWLLSSGLLASHRQRVFLWEVNFNFDF